MEFLLYLLVFLFGFITHRTFHAYIGAKTGSLIFLHCKLISLLVLLRALEQYNFTKAHLSLQMKQKGLSDNDVAAFNTLIDNDIDNFKKHAIKQINKQIPDYLQTLESFYNWDEAMLYVAKFKQEIPRDLYDKKN